MRTAIPPFVDLPPSMWGETRRRAELLGEVTCTEVATELAVDPMAPLISLETAFRLLFSTALTTVRDHRKQFHLDGSVTVCVKSWGGGMEHRTLEEYFNRAVPTTGDLFKMASTVQVFDLNLKDPPSCRRVNPYCPPYPLEPHIPVQELAWNLAFMIFYTCEHWEPPMFSHKDIKNGTWNAKLTDCMREYLCFSFALFGMQSPFGIIDKREAALLSIIMLHADPCDDPCARHPWAGEAEGAEHIAPPS